MCQCRLLSRQCLISHLLKEMGVCLAEALLKPGPEVLFGSVEEVRVLVDPGAALAIDQLQKSQDANDVRLIGRSDSKALRYSASTLAGKLFLSCANACVMDAWLELYG